MDDYADCFCLLGSLDMNNIVASELAQSLSERIGRGDFRETYLCTNTLNA